MTTATLISEPELRAAVWTLIALCLGAPAAIAVMDYAQRTSDRRRAHRAAMRRHPSGSVQR